VDAGTPARIDTLEQLRAHYAGPRTAAKLKCLDRLDEFSRLFIAWSPFFVLASSNGEGHCDASPRGDQPGFVDVVDDKVLQFPDRPGNNRLDTMTNLVTSGGVGMLFFIPGFDESLRINGNACISHDAALCEKFAVNGKPALSVVRVTVEEVYFHCGKALKRSRLWDPSVQRDRKTFPTHGRIIAEQTKAVSVKESEAYVEQSYRERLY
jgi:PPOX class probable FMN-dependent enzyme